MLKLRDIKKDYVTDFETVKALQGITLNFRKCEFVSILGPSGCGKTTLLNVVGGLDKYTTGDLIINEKSTKQFKDKDWDAYRNHSVGFVFQNYNLIPHQTILENVELALTLSGVSKAERKRRASVVLERVGLGDKLSVRPNQLSGGQMQRVAIARALVNDPDILLADEPTGALDSKTSVQILDLLKEISKDKLIIMVTHNSELAYSYSNRIIKLFDGLVVDDSNPYDDEEIATVEEKIVSEKTLENEEKDLENGTIKSKKSTGIAKTKKRKKTLRTSMSFFTALSLSLNNLLTKKTRTMLVAFAGSIGIIGIALILSLSNGFQLYINKVQEDTLSTYPLTIQETTIDMGTVLENLMGQASEEEAHELDKIYSSTVMVEMFQTMMSGQYQNNLKDFKLYLESDESHIKEYVSDIKYSYNLDMNIYSANTSNGIVKVSPSTIFQDMMQGVSLGGSGSELSGFASQVQVFSEMLDNRELLESQYDVVEGRWPTAYNEVVITCNENNEINDYILYALGIKDQKELQEIMNKIFRGEEVEIQSNSYTYDEILNYRFRLVLPTDYYVKNSTGVWEDKSDEDSYVETLVKEGLELRIVGIIRPSENGVARSINSTIGYTSSLTEYVIDQINRKEIVKEQINNPEIDVFTGRRFEKVTFNTYEDFYAYISENYTPSAASLAQTYVQSLPGYGTEEGDSRILRGLEDSMNTENTYENNVLKLGINDLDNPSMISLYPVDFESKDKIISTINEYNANQKASNNDQNVIQYTDYIGILMSSISDVINAVTYVLIAFVAISLVVSSIMIGIITYISVLERIKEIGILRSVGASKRDISNVFNAETLIIGFVSGSLGILITVLLDIPVNILINHLAGIGNVAKLPVVGAIILIAISMVLSLVAGLIPSRIASKKDPVEALRSE